MIKWIKRKLRNYKERRDMVRRRGKIINDGRHVVFNVEGLRFTEEDIESIKQLRRDSVNERKT